MSGECDKCGEHTLDCLCKYPRCEKCQNMIYRLDGECMKCLAEDVRKFLWEVIERWKKFDDIDNQ